MNIGVFAVVVMLNHLLWPPCGIGQAIIFLPCDFYLLFFPRLISAVGDWMSTILPHSANLECMSEMCCTRLSEIQDAKIAILAPSHNFVRLYLRS